jgi:hypothetical protein
MIARFVKTLIAPCATISAIFRFRKPCLLHLVEIRIAVVVDGDQSIVPYGTGRFCKNATHHFVVGYFQMSLWD